jgi:putative thioredoxin
MNSVDITLENVQQLVIDESFKRLVIVDFWADWCAPCKNLTPILEKLAQEYRGEFLLAKVNADDQQMLAGQFGVRSLPTVMLIREGQPLDGFSGDRTEVQLRQLLSQYLPKPWEQTLDNARQLVDAGDFDAALPLMRQVYEESQHQADVACLLARALVELKRTDEAEAVLGTVKLGDQNAAYEQVKAQLQLSKQAGKTPEITALEAAHKADPGNADIAYQLAVQLHQEGYHRPALELLMEILRKDRNYADGAARKTLMDILASLGKADPLAVEFQRKLFMLLY